ncbi:response regulator [Subsaximicrobium wynnwilliamsii]|uniref:Response regulator n=1 Tax=Subsaximicrobium wynnwilliamsii TaxID=291179 RepID=A0A5C6ZNW2_9FLAO|nr:response regulator [Subsaximicrobium wynnwilliamsii]TXD85222.1 response regulator [Subsaximicrobium wynnwilliamsii]TXD91265.1 response regulator [Subsaximicrobium wynnwilliamsii]TXE04658.1 response regulator [Subsaximicrobium wynnwilliamsii]
MTQTTKRFLLVDDDPLNNYLTKMVLKKSFEGAQVKDFSIPEDGLGFIGSAPNQHPSDEKTILFLDINMPTLSGWEFLAAFDRFDASIKAQYNIYILSSSVDLNDINLAKANPLVLDFIEKPLNKAKLVELFG